MRKGLFILILLLALPVAYSATISACGSIGKPGTYVLTANLTLVGSGTCLQIDSDDVIIDCNGSWIAGEWDNGVDEAEGGGVVAYGANVTGRTNVTFKNCEFRNLTVGIKVYSSSDINVLNTKFYNIQRAIEESSSQDILVQNSIFDYITKGIVVGTANYTINKTTFHRCGDLCIDNLNAYPILFTSSKAINSSHIFYQSKNLTIDNGYFRHVFVIFRSLSDNLTDDSFVFKEGMKLYLQVSAGVSQFQNIYMDRIYDPAINLTLSNQFPSVGDEVNFTFQVFDLAGNPLTTFDYEVYFGTRNITSNCTQSGNNVTGSVVIPHEGIYRLYIIVEEPANNITRIYGRPIIATNFTNDQIKLYLTPHVKAHYGQPSRHDSRTVSSQPQPNDGYFKCTQWVQAHIDTYIHSFPFKITYTEAGFWYKMNFDGYFGVAYPEIDITNRFDYTTPLPATGGSINWTTKNITTDVLIEEPYYAYAFTYKIGSTGGIPYPYWYTYAANQSHFNITYERVLRVPEAKGDFVLIEYEYLPDLDMVNITIEGDGQIELNVTTPTNARYSPVVDGYGCFPEGFPLTGTSCSHEWAPGSVKLTVNLSTELYGGYKRHTIQIIRGCACSTCRGCGYAANDTTCDIVKVLQDMSAGRGDCVITNATNKVIDCDGHGVSGTGFYGFLFTGSSNVTLKKCVMEEFFSATIKLVNSSALRILETNVSSTTANYGIYAENSEFSVLSCHINESKTGIGVSGSNVTINQTVLQGTDATGSYAINATNSNVDLYDSNISDWDYAVAVTGGSLNVKDAIVNSNNYGVWVQGAPTTLNDNYVCSNVQYDVWVNSSSKSGTKNTCERVYGWNDSGSTWGCLYSCNSTCFCDGCARCKAYLEAPYSCSVVKLSQSISSASSCMYDPAIPWSKTFDCQYNQIVGARSGYGIYVDTGDGCKIQNCFISNYSKALYFVGISDWIVTNITITNSEVGLAFNQIDNFTFQNLNISGCDVGVYGGGGWYHTISNFVVDGRDLCYYKGISGITISSDCAGVWLVNSSDVNITNQNSRRVSPGIAVIDSQNVKIEDSTISFSDIGIRLQSSSADVRNVTLANLSYFLVIGYGVYSYASNVNLTDVKLQDARIARGLYFLSTTANVVNLVVDSFGISLPTAWWTTPRCGAAILADSGSNVVISNSTFNDIFCYAFYSNSNLDAINNLIKNAYTVAYGSVDLINNHASFVRRFLQSHSGKVEGNVLDYVIEPETITFQFNTSQYLTSPSTIDFTIQLQNMDGSTFNGSYEVKEYPVSNLDVDYSQSSANGTFVVDHAGMNVFWVNVTDGYGNKEIFVYPFYYLPSPVRESVQLFIDPTNYPTHGQPKGSDAVVIKETVPSSEGEFSCSDWIQAEIDEFSKFPIGIITQANISVVYKADNTAQLGIQRNTTYSDDLDVYQTIPSAASYTRATVNLQPNLALNEPWNILWTAVKLVSPSGNPTIRSSPADPSYVNLTLSKAYPLLTADMFGAVLGAVTLSEVNDSAFGVYYPTQTNVAAGMKNNNFYLVFQDGVYCYFTNCSYTTDGSNSINVSVPAGVHLYWVYDDDVTPKITINDPTPVNEWVNQSTITINYTTKDDIFAVSYLDLNGSLRSDIRFDEGSGSTFSDSKSGEIGVLGNSLVGDSYEPEWINAPTKWGLKFDGDDYATINISLNTGEYTLSFFFKPLGDANVILNLTDGVSSHIVSYSSSQLCVSDGANSYCVSKNLSGKWHRIDITRNSTTVAFWIDGVKVSETAATLTSFNANKLKFGPGLNGEIDHVLIYDRVIEPSEHNGLWNASTLNSSKTHEIQLSLDDGRYTICIYELDAAGNIASNCFFVGVDTNAPSFSFVSPTPLGTTTAKSGKINMSVSDNIEVNEVYLSLLDSMVVRLEFDEGYGTKLYDTASGYIFEAVDVNTTNADGNTPPKWVIGKERYGLKFDGKDDIVDYALPMQAINSNSFAISFWVKIDDFSAYYSREYIVGGFGDEYWNSGFSIFYDSSGNIYFYVGYDTILANDRIVNNHYAANYIIHSSGYNYIDGKWHHVAGVFDLGAQNMSLYIDGKLVASREIDKPMSKRTSYFAVGSAGIGRYWATGRNGLYNKVLNGSLDDLILFNRSLDAKEVKLLYNISKLAGYHEFYGNDISLYYKLDGSCTDQAKFNVGCTEENITYGTGIFGQAATFSGNSYLKTNSFNLSDFTIALWIKPTSLTGTHYIFDKDNAEIYIDGDDVVLNVSTNAGYKTITAVDAVDSGWNYLVVLGNENYTAIYVNGVQVAFSNDSSTITASTDDAYFGWKEGTGFGFEGQMDEIMVFNETLSGDEIRFLYLTSARDFNNYEANFTNLSDGVYKLYGVATDNARNSANDTRLFVLDTLSPAIYYSNADQGIICSPNVSIDYGIYDMSDFTFSLRKNSTELPLKPKLKLEMNCTRGRCYSWDGNVTFFFYGITHASYQKIANFDKEMDGFTLCAYTSSSYIYGENSYALQLVATSTSGGCAYKSIGSVSAGSRIWIFGRGYVSVGVVDSNTGNIISYVRDVYSGCSTQEGDPDVYVACNGGNAYTEWRPFEVVVNSSSSSASLYLYVDYNKPSQFDEVTFGPLVGDSKAFFDGVDDTLEYIPYSNLKAQYDSFKIEMIVYKEGNGTLISLGSPNNTVKISNDRINILMRINESVYGGFDGQLVPNGWVNITVVFNGTHIIDYVNGTKEVYVSIGGSGLLNLTDSSYNVTIGSENGTDFFRGWIEKIVIYRSTSGATRYLFVTDFNNVYNDAVFEDRLVEGKRGHGFLFSDYLDSLQANVDESYKLNEFTVAFWAYSLPRSSNYAILVVGPYGLGYYQGWRVLYNYALKKYLAQIVVEGTRYNLFTTNTFEPGRWNFLVLKKNATGVYFYVNGNLEASQLVSGNVTYLAVQKPLYVGTSTTSYPTNAIIDEFMLYDVPLTDAQIKLLYVITYDKDAINATLSEGVYDFGLTATDILSHSSVATYLLDIRGKDLNVTSVTPNTTTPKEEDTVKIDVDIENDAWNTTTGDVFVYLEKYNGSAWLVKDTLSKSVTIAPYSSITETFYWSAKPGKYRIRAVGDPSNVVRECYETNNEHTYYEINVPYWSYLYGNITGLIALGTSGGEMMRWESEKGNIYVVDADYPTVDFSLLKPFNATDKDFEDADTALEMAGSDDCFENLFDSNHDDVADRTMTFIVYGNQMEVPVIYSVDGNPAFSTGLLYEGNQFNGTQKIVVVSNINASQPCDVGVCDFVIRLPVAVQLQDTTTKSFTIYVELQ